MHYNKGEQLTVGMLKGYLAMIPDDVKICVGIGSEVVELHYLLNRDGNLLLHPDSYMTDAVEENWRTIMSFNTK